MFKIITVGTMFKVITEEVNVQSHSRSMFKVITVGHCSRSLQWVIPQGHYNRDDIQGHNRVGEHLRS